MGNKEIFLGWKLNDHNYVNIASFLELLYQKVSKNFIEIYKIVE